MRIRVIAIAGLLICSGCAIRNSDTAARHEPGHVTHSPDTQPNVAEGPNATKAPNAVEDPSSGASGSTQPVSSNDESLFDREIGDMAKRDQARAKEDLQGRSTPNRKDYRRQRDRPIATPRQGRRPR